MADVEPALDGVAATVTLATTTVRRVKVPAGCATLIISSPSAFYHQPDPAQSAADGDGTTAASAQWYPAGVHRFAPQGAQHAGGAIQSARYELFYGSVASQALYARALSEAPT